MLDDTGASMAKARQSETIWRGSAGPVSPPDALTGTEAPEKSSGSSGATAQERPRKRWFAIQHEAHHGGYARLSIKALGFRVHWPREIVRPHRGDDVLVPLFRGYLFAEFDRDKSWSGILRAGGVISILGVREFGAPIPAPVGEVERLIQRCGGDDGLIDTTDDAKPLPFRTADVLSPGEEVTFLDHALFGQAAVIDADKGRAHVEVLMKMFGMECRARVPRSRVKPRQVA